MNRRSIFVAGWLVLSLALAGSGTTLSAQEVLGRGYPSLAPMLENVTPAVVNIRVSKTIPTSGRYFFQGEEVPEQLRRFLPDTPQEQNRNRRPFAVGAGSGVIIDAGEGYIVTNHHVVSGAANITVQLSDGRALEAEMVGSDANTDIALLQVRAEGLVDIDLAETDSVRVGDFVVAIGNPFGIGQTVTSGIVSALGRTGINSANFEDFIQTDAAINVGNSGGALVDMEGKLIGINTAIISGDGGNNGIGFAVPADMVAAVTAHLERDGEVRRGMLGVSITTLTPDVQQALDVAVDEGALITSVLPGSAAERAGLQVSDIITALDGEAIATGRDLRNQVGLMRRDEEVELVIHRDGEQLTVAAVIGGEGGAASGADARSAESGGFRGAQLRNLNSRDDLGVDAGVLVDSLNPQSRAAASGLREGDIVVAVNRQAVDDLEAFNKAIESGGRFAALTVIRDSREMLLLVR